jgi:hypothetical protein
MMCAAGNSRVFNQGAKMAIIMQFRDKEDLLAVIPHGCAKRSRKMCDRDLASRYRRGSDRKASRYSPLLRSPRKPGVSGTICLIWRNGSPSARSTISPGTFAPMEKAMKQIRLRNVAIATSTFALTALLSVGWSEQQGVSLSVESAQARIGRPLTPVSVAGVARRQYRRSAYGAGVVGAGVAGAVAVGAAATVGGPYYAGWGGGPYYGGGTWGNRLYIAPAPAVTSSGLPWYAVRAYYAGGPWYYGYGGWPDYRARNGIVCDPGTDIKGGDGVMYLCQ